MTDKWWQSEYVIDETEIMEETNKVKGLTVGSELWVVKAETGKDKTSGRGQGTEKSWCRL